MGREISFSCCALVVLAVLWSPAYSNDACSPGCKGSSSSATFQPSTKYTYNLEGVVDIFLTAADKQETSAKLNAQVTVTALGNCAHVLRVKSLHITGPDGKKHGNPSGIEKPIRFTLENGLLGPEMCTEEGDHQRSLNIKRAIISLLTTSKKQSSEVDVFGVCPTEVSSSHEAGAELVHRSRDLTRCAHREKGKHDLITSIYNPKAEIKSTNILQSSLNVESKVKNGIPEKVSATEEYLYTPFSVGQNGARAKVATKLALTGQAGGTDTGAFKNVKSVIFENPHPENTEHNNQANVLSALKSAAQSLQGHASSKSASIFAQLVKIFRVTSKDDLLSVFGQIKAGGAVKDNNLIKKVFLDALLRAGTGDSIEVSIKLLQGHELSDFEQKLVFLSLGNARHASSSSIAAAATLLDQPNLPKEVYLGVGALAGTYCREHTCHGATTQDQGIAALAQKFAAKIGNCKTKTKPQEDTLVAVLKGVRNVRHIENSLLDKLIHCVTDASVKSRVKVAALEAFHADPCTPKLQKTAIDAMKNRQLDSEIRIKAYLVLLECPNNKAASEIKNLIETEPVHQVGRFISSSLAHVRASANPDREQAKQYFGQIRTPQKFNVDETKYSTFREFSYNIDSLGLGATAERTIIFSQDSFLPRSSSLNLTTQIFGHSFNVLELGVRQGNLDRVLEHFFGPKGLFRSHKPQEVYDILMKKYSEVRGKVDQHVRGRRAVQQEIANFAKQVKGDTNAFDDELDLDIVVKIFGTDAIFLSLGDDQGFSFDTVIEKILKEFDTGAKAMQHFSHELRSHMIFLDAELAYPTSVGLPLKLNLVGSATTRIEIGGSVDVHQIAKNPNDAKIDLKVVPSTNIEIAGTFTVDADFITTGLKVVSNLHSSTGGHLVAKVLENGKGFDLQFGLPVEKEELFTFTHDLVFVTNEKGQQETEVALKVAGDNNAQYKGCFDQLSKAIGLTFCGEVSVPFKIQGPEASASFKRLAARYPLTGPSKVSVFLEKNDLKNYHVKGLLREEGAKRGFELVLEAEGAKTNRKTALSGEYVNSDSDKRVKLSFESPIKTASAELAYVNHPNELSALVKVTNDAEEYYGRLGFTVAGNQQRSVYTPLIEYKLPKSEKQTLQVEGQVIRQSQSPSKPGFKYSFNGIKINMPDNNEKVLVDGFIANEARGFSGELKAVKGEMKVDVKGTFDDPKYNMEFQNTINPNVNFKFDLHSIKESGHYQNDLNLVYGPDLNSNRNKFTLNQNLKYHYTSPQEFNIITKNHITCPALELEVKADGEFDPKKVDVEFETKYQNTKAELDLEARTEVKTKGDYIVKFEADLDDKGVHFLSKRDIVSEDKSNFENVLTIKPGGKYELSGVVNHKAKPGDINVGAVGHLKVAGKNEDIKFDFGVISNPTLYNTHAKVSAGTSELVNLLVKINKGTNPTGQLVLNLKDTITANGQFKSSDSDGKGNGAVVVDFKKLGRKMKGVVDFVRKSPQYNANVDIFLDFDKDNNNKIHISTQTNAKPGHLDTRNQLVIAGQKTAFNAKVEHSGTASNGKFNGLAELILPNERAFTYKINREASEQNKVQNANLEHSLSDTPKRGSAGSTIAFKHKISNLRTVEEIPYFDYTLHATVNLIDGKNLAYAIEAKNTLGEPMSSYTFKSDVTGNLIPQPASLSGNIDYNLADNMIDGTTKYRLKGNYGSDFNFALDGTEDVQLFEAKQKKYVDDFTLQLGLPFDKAHDIKVTANTMFFLPENSETLAEYQLGGSVQVNSDVYKIDTAGKFGVNSGYEKIKVIVPHNDPFILDSSYHRDVKGEKKSGGFEIKSSYGKGKSASIIVDSVKVSETEYSLSVKANAPQAEKLKKLEVNFNNKRPNANTVISHLVVEADGRVYKLESNSHFSRVSPLFDIQFTYPESTKPSKFYVKGSNLNDHGGKLDFKFENIRDADVVGALDVHTSNDNVNIKMDIDAPKFKLDKYHVEIVTKEAGNGKRLEFQTTNGGKNLLSGSTSFVNKQEGSKTIIEGSGTLKVREEQKSATFKYIRDVLSEGQEQGVEEFINIAVGDRSIVIESRNTNLELKHSQVYCEEKKQCAHAEFNSKINVATPGLLQNTVNIVFDLRKLGFSPEFGLQMSSEVGDNKLPQYQLDVHLNQEQNKYYLHAYSQPAAGAFPAGITLTLPKRVIALESTLSYPQGKALPFPIKGEVAFYLDKKHQPKQKAALRLLTDVTANQDSHSAVAEFGFSHPTLDKEILVKYDFTLAHPKDSFKFDLTGTLSHPAFGSNKVGKALFEVSPTKLRILLRNPLVEIINVDGDVSFSKELQKIDMTVMLLQGKKVQVYFMAQNFQKFEFSTGYLDQEGKLSVIAELKPQEHAEISTDLFIGKEKKNMFRLALSVKDNLVKPEYSVSTENFKYFANAVKNDVSNLGKRLHQLSTEAHEKALNDYKKITPVLEKLAQSYKTELAKLKEEVVNDKALQDISKLFSSIVNMVVKIIDDIITHTTPLFEKVNADIKEVFAKTKELYDTKIAPQLKMLFDNISTLVNSLYQTLIDLVSHFVALIQDFLKKHEAEFQELTNIFSEIFKDLNRLIMARCRELRARASAIFEETFEKIKNLPVIEMIKEKFAELQVPEQVLQAIQKLILSVETLLPNEETKGLAKAIDEYIEKKLTNAKIDDKAEIRAIFEKLEKVIATYLNNFRAQILEHGVPTFLTFNAFRVNPSAPYGRFPILGSISFSPLNYLRNGDFPSPLQFIRAYRPRFLPTFPSRLNGVVVNGQHIFTFDGRHLTFPGSCRYVLAHDHGDSNFTLAMQLQNGAPKAIVLTDKTGTVIEIKDNGHLALNGANHGFPVHNEDTFAFKTPDGKIGLGSTYGIMALCSPKLTVCSILVDGFYLGKLRGLLGDGNNEQFDDFKMPNGKIAHNEAEFGNSYRLASSCPQVKTPEHSHDHGTLSPACEVIFGGTSTLTPLFFFMDPAPFKQACAHATASNAANAQQEACDIGAAYILKLGMPALLPSVCVKCHDGESITNIGEASTHELPKTQADIVIAVELTKKNEHIYSELMVPLVGHVVDQLKQKKIDDVKVYLVGMTSEFPYPLMYDTDNAKLKGAKPKFTVDSRYNQLFKPIVTNEEKVDKFLNYISRVVSRLQNEFDFYHVYGGYNQLGDIPYRPNAVKTVISLVSETCTKAVLPFQDIKTIVKGTMLHKFGITNHVITVTPDLKIGGGKQDSQVVGFDDDSVIMLGDKKRVKDSEQLRETLHFTPDACIEFGQRTKGTIFSASNFNALNPGQKKQFGQSAAHNIVDKLLANHLQTSCRCMQVDAFRAKNVCFVESEKPATRR